MWKARLTYGLWLVGAALLYVFTDRYYALVLLLASVAGPMVCVLCNLCRRTGPAVSLHLAPSAAKGEKTEGMLKLDNRTALPMGRIDCTIREENRLTGESVSRTVSLRLPGRTAAKLPFTLESRHGGAACRVSGCARSVRPVPPHLYDGRGCAVYGVPGHVFPGALGGNAHEHGCRRHRVLAGQARL